MGVAPLHSGSGSFQATFDSAVHLIGSPVSLLVPFNCGPRHCGQLSADKVTTTIITSDIDAQMRFMGLEFSEQATTRSGAINSPELVTSCKSPSPKRIRRTLAASGRAGLCA